ncbi:MAG: hypothetical protein H0U92_14140 [Actinobacteria bacterium]|nr:hypothetical protein [Actinomycetota bacterium]
MRRLVLLAAAAAATLTLAAPQPARAAGVPMGEYASTTNDLLSRIPGFGGGETRHICLISDRLDRSWCVYVPLP